MSEMLLCYACPHCGQKMEFEPRSFCAETPCPNCSKALRLGLGTVRVKRDGFANPQLMQVCPACKAEFQYQRNSTTCPYCHFDVYLYIAKAELNFCPGCDLTVYRYEFRQPCPHCGFDNAQFTQSSIGCVLMVAIVILLLIIALLLAFR
jgi:hypothetical protein